MGVDRRGGGASLASDRYALWVGTTPFACELSDREQGRRLWRMQAVRRLVAVEAERLVVQFTAEDGTPVALGVVLDGDQVTVELWAGDPGTAWLAVDLEARPGEHFLGLGERFDALDQRGKRVDLWVEDGAQRGLTYIPVPFYLSSEGYGLHIDTEVRCVARMATPDDPGVVSIRIHSASFPTSIPTPTKPRRPESRSCAPCR